MKRVNPEMIVIGRESRGMTQSELANHLSVSQTAISRIEGDLLSVSNDMLKELCCALDYPESFFFLDEKILGPGISGMGIIYHRKRKNIPLKIVAMIQAQINIRRMHISKLLRGVELEKPYEIPHLDVDDYNGDIRKIASLVRAAWNLPQGPIKNLTECIEEAGGIVIKIDFGTTKIDALCQHYPGLPPIFFVNSKSPGDRLRFTLAHELGHIVMHRVPNDNMENEADVFASELLMPSKDIKSLLTNVSLRTLANLKPYWKVSMASMLLKSRDLGTITPRAYSYLWMEMGKAGYRRREPIDIPIEEPNTMKNLISLYREDLGYGASEISKIIALNDSETNLLYFQPYNIAHLNIVKNYQ